MKQIFKQFITSAYLALVLGISSGAMHAGAAWVLDDVKGRVAQKQETERQAKALKAYKDAQELNQQILMKAEQDKKAYLELISERDQRAQEIAARPANPYCPLRCQLERQRQEEEQKTKQLAAQTEVEASTQEPGN